MSLADELLETAKYLIRQNNNRPTDGALRRSVSTAYYALFHHLVEAAVQHLVTEGGQRASISRSFAHTTMKRVCEAIRDNKLPFLGPTVSDDLIQLTTTFADLQEQRHDADYNRIRSFTRADARDFVKRVEKAFAHWEAIQSTPVAGPFLLLLLVGEPKSR